MKRIAIADLNASAQELTDLRALLAAGGLAAVPTETFYGLAANPKSEGGVQRVFEVKGRSDDNPLAVLFGAREQLEYLGVTAPAALLDRFFLIWPAPLTVVLPIERPIAASRGLSTLAVRMPGTRALILLLESIGAVTGTSANISGEPALDDPDAVAAVFEPRLDVLVDGGKTPGDRPSTLIDATVDPPVVLRDGAHRWMG
ncbi:MAG: L-threonylcarbamoyladenylate synthase [Thermoanaerobaculia bacterium]